MPALTAMGAVCDLLEADGTVPTLVPGGIYAVEAPEEHSLPLVVVVDDGSSTQDTSEAVYIETTRLKVKIFTSRDATAQPTDPVKPVQTATKIKLAVQAALDRAPLTVTDSQYIGTWRDERATLEFDKDKDREGERVADAVVAYRVMLQRNYPR